MQAAGLSGDNTKAFLQSRLPQTPVETHEGLALRLRLAPCETKLNGNAGSERIRGQPAALRSWPPGSRVGNVDCHTMRTPPL
jgi:hypothetical protein